MSQYHYLSKRPNVCMKNVSFDRLLNSCHADWIKMPHTLLIFSQSNAWCWYKFTYWMANGADPDQLASSELIWIYTVCKGRIYPDSAGQILIIFCRTWPISGVRRYRDSYSWFWIATHGGCWPTGISSTVIILRKQDCEQLTETFAVTRKQKQTFRSVVTAFGKW